MIHRAFKTKVKISLPKVSIVKNEHHFSLYHLAAFGLAFASIGTYFFLSSFASAATFGKTSIGTSCDTFTGDTKRVNRYNIGATVTVSKLSVYLKPGVASGGQQLKGILYADDNGAPGSLVATTSQLIFQHTDSAGWYTLAFAAPPTLHPGGYWIGILSGNTARAASYCYDTANTNVRDLDANSYISGASNTFGSISSQDNRYMSIYATYTTNSSSNTFGKTSIGTSCDTFTNDWKRVNKYNVSSNVTVSQLNIYLRPGTASGSQSLKGVLYNDNNGTPGSLVATTSQLMFYYTNPAGWYTLPFAAPPTINAGNYWIGIITGNTARVAGYCYDTASGNVRAYNTNAYTSGPSSTFGSVSFDSRAMSLSANYTAAGGGKPSVPSVNLVASPTSVTAGQSSILNWSSSNATACSATWTSSKATNGSQQVTPGTTTTYVITCTGTGGSASTNATVSVSPSGSHPSPTVNLSANPASIVNGQSATLNWTSTNATACSATWTSSKATNGSQSLTPSTTTTYGITCTGTGGSASTNATVSVSPSGGGGGIGGCATTLTGSQNTQLLNNTFHLQANEWASSAPFAICTDGNADFKITTSGINQSGGAPGAYPSLYKGCHWGYCTSNSGLPVPVSMMVTTQNKVTTSYNTTVIPTGSWDDAYDNWYNPSSSTSSNNTGLEMMIWINHHGSIQPAGSIVNNNVLIDGMSWTVWHGGNSPGGTVSYVLNSPTTSVANLDLGPFSADSVNRGYMTNSWYLIDVEAGFEPWIGGQGLTANSFNVVVH